MKAYRIIAHLIAGCVVLQAMWIGLGNFTMFHDIDNGKVIDENNARNLGVNLHGLFGLGVIPLLAIALLILSFFVKFPGSTQWAGYVVLGVVLQIALVFLAFPIPAFGALHALNAFAVIGLAENAARRVPASTDAVDAAATV
jgi:hypothetical protein